MLFQAIMQSSESTSSHSSPLGDAGVISAAEAIFPVLSLFKRPQYSRQPVRLVVVELLFTIVAVALGITFLAE